jgi:superfamily I DNA/RNA helicase
MAITNHSIAAAKIDGQAEALKLLRKIRRLNAHRDQPSKSADVIAASFRAIDGWPATERARFLFVMQHLIARAVVDGSFYSLEEFADILKFGQDAVRAERERDFQDYLAQHRGDPGTPVH